MKYYKGDIVEIITADFKNGSDIDEYVKRNQIQGSNFIPNTFVGLRFRINFIFDFDKHLTLSSIYDEKHKCISTKDTNVILYKRPIKNWIKFIFDF